MQTQSTTIFALILWCLPLMAEDGHAESEARIVLTAEDSLFLSVKDEPMGSILLALGEKLELETKVIGELDDSPLTLEASGPIDEVLEELLDGYSFVLTRTARGDGRSDEVSGVIVLTNRGEGTESAGSRNELAENAEPISSQEEADTARTPINNMEEHARRGAEELSRNWGEAEEKAKLAHEKFLNRDEAARPRER